MTAYVYKWTHKPSLGWYVGVSAGKRKNYICSSRLVKASIMANPDEWEKTIIATGEYDAMFDLETDILQTFDARNDVRSFNRHNNDGISTILCQTPEAKAKRRAALKGVPKTEAHRAAVAEAKRGSIMSIETKKKISVAMKGKPWSAARRAALNKNKETI